MRDFLILVGFCVFTFLLGMRLKRRLEKKKPQEGQIRIRKNQRPKMAAGGEEPPLVRERRLRRERRTHYFTVVLLFVLFGLMIFMIPALVTDLSMPDRIQYPHFFFTLFYFCIHYLYFRSRICKGEPADKGAQGRKTESSEVRF